MSRLFEDTAKAAGRSSIADLISHLAQKTIKPGRTKSRKKAKKRQKKWPSHSASELNHELVQRGAALCPSTEED
ncbi:MAG: hypothetical protein ACLQT6_14805 [Desulfomonilaceae bacterium]